MKTTAQGNRPHQLSFRKSLTVLTLLLLIISFSPLAVAQENSATPGTLSVRVVDPQAAALANAQVTLYTRDNQV